MHDFANTLIELGAVCVGLAMLARFANKFKVSTIAVYLLAGLAFGRGGLLPLDLSKGFIELGAEIGVLLLLFMLGLEYSGKELQDSLKRGLPAGVLDFVFNFFPGLLAGFFLKFAVLPAVLLGGITYVSSSGIIAKVLGDLRRLGNPETQTVLSVLVIEDLTMAVYLPLVAVLLIGGGFVKIAVAVSIAIVTVTVVLLLAVRFGGGISRLITHESEEIILLTTFGLILLVAGIAQRLQVSAAIGAFLVGIALSGQVAKRSHVLFAPLRDLFAATFFFFFGLDIDPMSLTPALGPALVLAVITALTKVATGYMTTAGVTNWQGRLRAGVSLIPRGEFSIVIAGLGWDLQPQLGPLSAAYVLMLAIVGPMLMRAVGGGGSAATNTGEI